ncbi:MAG: hypothetical protein HYZ53_26745 [Planctomycetes bacterium]|nr:hypothetical protein [Planctomycetota bacterium]
MSRLHVVASVLVLVAGLSGAGRSLLADPNPPPPPPPPPPASPGVPLASLELFHEEDGQLHFIRGNEILLNTDGSAEYDHLTLVVVAFDAAGREVPGVDLQPQFHFRDGVILGWTEPMGRNRVKFHAGDVSASHRLVDIQSGTFPNLHTELLLTIQDGDRHEVEHPHR